MNAELRKTINNTYEVMRKHRHRNDRADPEMRKCNKCGNYFHISETHQVEFGGKNYRYCNYCKVGKGWR